MLTSVLVILFLLSPFFLGPGGKLWAYSSVISEQSLIALQKKLLENYVKHEKLFEKQQLQKREWEQRQLFLCNRYLDVTRRLDAVRFQGESHVR
jgi:hypothetical protein